MKTTKGERERITANAAKTKKGYVVRVEKSLLCRLIADADEADEWMHRYTDLWQAVQRAQVELDGPWRKGQKGEDS